MKLAIASLLILSACTGGNKFAYVKAPGVEVVYATDCASPVFSRSGDMTTYECEA